jgi:site-specific DNA-methyltransferase (adenine-specific)
MDKAAGVEFNAKPASGVGFMNNNDDGYNTTLNQLVQVGESTAEAREWEGWGTALKPAHEPIVMARKPLDGTVANNVLTHGVGGINIDGCRVGSESVQTNRYNAKGDMTSFRGSQAGNPYVSNIYEGRFPANFIHDGSDEVLELFPRAKGGAYPAKRGQAVNTAFASGQETEGGFRAMGDDGSAARFFYCAKANKTDRNEGLDGFAEKREADRIISDGVGGDNPRNRSNTPKLNHHPTVKPTELMRYLCRLVTPPNGTVLDPFTGSGSTGKAATLEGFTFIGIEQSAEYAEIANARINHAKENK